ncbi:MFS transporter [Amycolatopsis taiwanensis]|uniref:Major facilitator superfamily (MFS) profile domain-containing protein n=1 Tax=Amycolatopsis taiwanensis TaxID=342230 RepID=A0A9W6R5Z0_9PSEU|nr:MFS transporter [Amycolatopsis taiwanensis]GLY70061.1 hypothetical protein Atai01_66800 [Amycolatopsis taiwanensis]
MTAAHARSAESPQAAKVRPNAVVAVLAFSGIVVSFMQTLVIPVIPELPVLLKASASDTSWAITATLLAAAVATPTMGRLGDMYGKRRMLLLSVVVMVGGSVVCGLSNGLELMVVGRALQGLSAGVIPLGISIMRDELPAERLASATALMSASLGVGGALGLPAAALLAEWADWHVLFWTSAGLGAVAAVLVVALVGESRVRTGGRFDLLGALGMSVALLCLLLAISKGADWGWGSRLTLGLLAAAVVILLAWGWWELRTREPLVDLRTTARRQVLLTNLASVVFGFAMFAMSLVLPQLLQLPKATGYGLGQSMIVAGLALAPGGLLMMATAPVSARISRTMGPKVTLMIGAIVVAAGYGLGTMLMSAVWQVMIVAGVISAGVGLAYGAMPALVMGAVPVSETAAANSLNTLMRSIGTSTSSAVAGVILANMTTRLGPVDVPAKDGFHVVLAVSAGAALGAFVIAVFLPARRRAAQQSSPRHAAPEPAVETAARPGIGEITGTLRTRHGGAVPGGVVTVTSPGGQQISRVRSGDTGRYTVAGLKPGVYTIIVTASGFGPEAASVSLNGAGAVRDFELAGQSIGRLYGTVTAPNGEGLANATISVTDDDGSLIGSVVTDVHGNYELRDLAPGEYTVVTTLYTPAVQQVSLAAGDQAVVDLDLIAADPEQAAV